MDKKAALVSFLLAIIVFGYGVTGLIAKRTFDESIESLKIEDGVKLEDVQRMTTETRIKDERGKVVYRNYNGNRFVKIKIGDMPKHVTGAFVALEDERFYSHNGIDLIGIARSIVKNIKSGSIKEGASTITQQVIKNNYLTTEKTWVRKIKEQVLALELEKVATKDQILESYLNDAYLAHGNYGVGAAASFYFAKKAKELAPDEAAVIAGITQLPSKYSPLLNPDSSREKAKITLKKMYDQGYISKAQYDEFKGIKCLDELADRDINEKAVETSFYVDAVLKEVSNDLAKEYGEDEAYNFLHKEGVTIKSFYRAEAQNAVDSVYKTDQRPIYYKVTMILPDDSVVTKTASTRQAAVNLAVSSKAEFYEVLQQPQGACVVVDNRTQRIIAMAGAIGEKKFSRSLNRATDSLRQPGSSIKPLASYSVAFENGYAPFTKIIDEKIDIAGFSPKNWYDGYKGTVDFKSAVAVSMNIPAVKIAKEMGTSKLIDQLEEYGITTLTSDDNNLALAIGGISKGVSLSEMSKAYSSIANYGMYRETKLYSEVVDNRGNLLLKTSEPERRVITDKTARMLIECMKAVVERPYPQGTGNVSNLANSKIEQACKTGTTDEAKDQWIIGFTSDYTVGIWQGYDSPQEMTNRESLPSLNWKGVMTRLMAGVSSAPLDSSLSDNSGKAFFESDASRLSVRRTPPVNVPGVGDVESPADDKEDPETPPAEIDEEGLED